MSDPKRIITVRPSFCRPEAYAVFAAQMETVDHTRAALVRAATAIAMHELPGTNLPEVERQLADLAGKVKSRLHSDDPQAVLAHLHETLFEDEDFAGNEQDYYNPDNSYLPRVLATRRGLPITLSLIYVCVAGEVGLTAMGVNMPGHFLARVETDQGPLIIDPFTRGRMLTREEAVEMVARTVGQPIEPREELFAAVTHRVWLARILNNLHAVFSRSGREDDMKAMHELRRLLSWNGLA